MCIAKDAIGACPSSNGKNVEESAIAEMKAEITDLKDAVEMRNETIERLFTVIELQKKTIELMK